ncbi:MAG: uroporphyrinogen decarboxylase family protein, partial [Bacteroidota bacterium]
MWDAYRAGKPIRVPVMLGINARFTMWMPEANPKGVTFEQYFSDPQIMLERQIEHAYWVQHHVPQDAEMGLPKSGWPASVDFQNTYEAAWLGCELRYYPDQVPDTIPMLHEDNKRLLFDKGIPDPFTGGLMQRNWDFYEHFKRRQEEGWTMFGRPIATVTPCALGTDGPMTVCCNVRGATEFLIDLVEDTEYALQLLDFVTTAIVTRLKAYRRHLGLPEKANPWNFADDSIETLSTEMYRELILPFHKQLVSELAEPSAPISIHLCGDVERHLVFLRDNLNIRSFDTGFPIDLGKARCDLGQDVELFGGPSVPLLCYGTPDEVREEVKRILQSGVMDGGKFVLREGNNLAPGTPLENLWAMY